MRGSGPIGLLLLVPALLAVLAADVLWPALREAGGRITCWPPLARLRERIGRLPVFLALPLFLIPEVCSRLGWVVSAWLILHGQAWRGLGIYVSTKLIAGSLALWMCSACLPVLLRVPSFAAAHGALLRSRQAASTWLRRRSGGRFAATMSRVRARRLTAGS